MLDCFEESIVKGIYEEQILTRVPEIRSERIDERTERIHMMKKIQSLLFRLARRHLSHGKIKTLREG